MLRCHSNQVDAGCRDVLLLPRDDDVQFGADCRDVILLPRAYVIDGRVDTLRWALIRRDKPDRPPVQPRWGLCQSRYVVNADVLMQTFLDLCCDELMYYTASIAELRSNRNVEITRYFTQHALPYLILAAATL